MSQLQKKLRSQAGETLVELMASIVVGTLSVSLLLSGIAVSAQINQKTEAVDARFYESLSRAEKKQQVLKPGEVVIQENGKSTRISVHIYGGEGLYSYEMSK